jgi:hypothetical protein
MLKGHDSRVEGIDADFAGWEPDLRRTGWKSLGMGEMGRIKGGLANESNCLDATKEDVSGRKQREVRVVVFVVVPTEEWGKPASGVQLACEKPRIVRLIFQRSELGFAEGIVIRHVRTAETSLDAQRAQKLSQGIALHCGASIGVNGQSGLHSVARDALGEELGGQVLALPVRDHPADDISTE